MRAKPHIMRRMNNKVIINILKALGAFVLLAALCASGALVFHSYYYDLIYVSGSSMYPTLNGDDDEKSGSKVDFGIVDAHQSALKNIKRFDIVSTYYPDSTDYDLANKTLKPSAKKKIKRVVAMPGETFKIEKGSLYVLNDGTFEQIKYTFKTNPSTESGFKGKDTVAPITLGDDEYWVLGDNREASRDCATLNTPIKKENLYGVLVAIEGKGSLYIKRYRCEICGKTYATKGGNVCPNCYVDLTPEYDVNNKHYHWPVFY